MDFEITINGRTFTVDVWDPYAGQEDTWGWSLYEGTKIVAETARGWDGNLTALGEAVYVASVIAADSPIELEYFRQIHECNLNV